MSEPSNYSATETLRNGQRIEIRALKPQDRDDLIAAVGRTSSESLYRRFFAVRRQFSETEESFYLNIDFASHVALVALAEENGQRSIRRWRTLRRQRAWTGGSCLHRGRQISGAGTWRGILRHLAVIARQAGLGELVAYVMPDNRAMLKVFAKSGLKYTAKREAGSVYVKLGLN